MSEELKFLLYTMETFNSDLKVENTEVTALCFKKNETKLLLNYIEQLQQENKELKEQYSKLEDKYIKNLPCCNEEDCDLYKEYLNDKNILTEFEKWLEDMYNYIGSTDVSKIIREYYFIFNIAEINVMLNTIEFVAHKLQELKEGKK